MSGAGFLLAPGSDDSAISNCKDNKILVESSATLNDNTGLSLYVKPGATKISVTGGTMDKLYFDAPSANTSVSIDNVKFDGEIYTSTPEANFDVWKDSGKLLFRNCKMKLIKYLDAGNLFPNDTSFDSCLLGGMTVLCEDPVFNKCHITGELVLGVKSSAKVNACRFIAPLSFMDGGGSGTSTATLDISGNSFLGPTAIYSNVVPSEPIKIGINYYGDVTGPSKGGGNFLSNRGAFVAGNQFFDLSGGFDTAGPAWEDKETFPIFWQHGLILGQNVISHAGGQPFLAQGKKTLLSMELCTSHPIVEGFKVSAEFDGTTVSEHNGTTILRRDISDYPCGSIASGEATYDFILPPCYKSEATLKIYFDDRDVSGGKPEDHKGKYLAWEQKINFRDPPQRPLKLAICPIYVIGYGVPSISDYILKQRAWLSSLIGVSDKDVQYIILPPDMNISVFTGYSGTFAPDMLLGVARRAVRNVISYTGLCDEADFYVSVFPGNSLPRFMGTNGFVCTLTPLNKMIYASENDAPAFTHELGHAGPGLYVNQEQYNMPEYMNTGGMPLKKVTIFNNNSAESGPFGNTPFLHIEGDEKGYAWTSFRNIADVMGNKSPEGTWIAPSTHEAITEYFYSLKAKTDSQKQKSAPPPAGMKRIFLYGVSEIDKDSQPLPGGHLLHRLLPGKVRAINMSSIETVPIYNALVNPTPGDIIFYDSKGAELSRHQYSILNNWAEPPKDPNYFWALSCDVPDSAVRVVVTGSAGTVADIRSMDKVSLSPVSPISGGSLANLSKIEVKAESWATGQPLQYVLMLSADGGTTWMEPIFSESPTFKLLPQSIPKSENTAIKVLCSDGLSAAVLDINNLTAPARQALITITNPKNGDSAFPGTLWKLEGAAYDLDAEKTIIGDWTSSIDGNLGHGASLENISLKPGTHTLTYSATAASGGTSSASVQVTVEASDSSPINIRLEKEDFSVLVPGEGPYAGDWTALKKGIEHHATLKFRNVGAEIKAKITISLTTPDSAETVLISETFEIKPFDTRAVSAKFTPSADGAYVFKGVVEAITPSETDTTDNTLIWTRNAGTQALISVSASGSGSGRIVSSPAGIDTATSSSAQFPLGQQISFTATADAGSVFVKWSGIVSGEEDSVSFFPTGDAALTAEFAKSRTVSVTNGEGGGAYAPGETVEIVADQPPAGSAFDRWTGDTNLLADPTLPETTFAMPDADIKLEAAYRAPLLTVVGGTGSGRHPADTEIPIAAHLAPEGKCFDKWTTDSEGIFGDPLASSTFFVMPPENSTVTANYKDIPEGSHVLKVTNGSGSGAYIAGTVVDIVADSANPGYVFDHWGGGDAVLVAKPHLDETTFTMPDRDADIEALFVQIQNSYTLTVLNGSGGGEYAYGQAPISADEAPDGMVFDSWKGAAVTDPSSPDTELAMPASDISVEATYRQTGASTRQLTVNGGTGSGSYQPGSVIQIRAESPEQGKIFDAWTGDEASIAAIDSAKSSTAIVTMPDADITLSSSYADLGFVAKVSLTSTHKETKKGVKDAYTISIKLDFSGTNYSPSARFDKESGLELAFGEWEFSGALGEDEKAKFAAKSGGAKLVSHSDDLLTVRWTAKMASISVKSRLPLDSGGNILDLSGQDSKLIEGSLDDCSMIFGEIVWNGSIPYRAKAAISSAGYQSWSAKGKFSSEETATSNRLKEIR